MLNYYAPTQGEDVGHWNVFPKDSAVKAILNVPFDELPDEVKGYLNDY